MIEGARQSGALLMQQFGRSSVFRIKESNASIVTESDLASERLLIDLLRRRFPDHGILGEEGGHIHQGAEFTWILDPLDGTSNFAAVLALLVEHARNTRATNSLVDFAYTADGRLGACVNFSMKLWDIAAPWIIVKEAGGSVTDLEGQPVALDLGPTASERTYPVVAGGPVLAAQVLELVRESGLRF